MQSVVTRPKEPVGLCGGPRLPGGVSADGGPKDKRTPSRSALCVAIGTFVLIVADVPGLSYTVWAPKMAALLVLGAAGLPVLVLRARSGRRSPTGPPAIAALVFVGIASIATAMSPAVLSAVVGLYDQGTGLVFVVALAGVWALGTTLSDDAGRSLLEQVVVAAAVVNAVVAVLQTTVGLASTVPIEGSHATGLLGNSVFFGAVCVAALAVLGGRFVDDPRRWTVPLVLVAAGIGASAQRLPALLMLGILIAEIAVAAYRSRYDGVPAKAALRAWFCGVTGVSWLVGSILWSLAHGKSLVGAFTSGGGAGAIGYNAQSTAQTTFGDRFGIWRVAATAVGHRPFFGYGPGQFRDATSGRLSLALARSLGATLFGDAHNLFVEYATTTGLLGLVALCAWLALAARNRRGRLLLMAVVLLLTGLAEPQNVVTTPLLFVALGAAALGGRRSGTDRRPLATVLGVPAGDSSGAEAPLRPGVPGGKAGRSAVVGCAVVAALAGLALVVGDLQYNQASKLSAVGSQSAAIRTAASADRELFPWPLAPSLMANAELIRNFGITPAAGAVAATYAQQAIRRDPTDADLWARLATIQFDAGMLAGARQSALTGLRLRPLDTSLLNTLGFVARRQGNRAEARRAFGRSLEVNPHQKAVRNLYTLGCIPPSTGILIPRSELCP